MTQIPDQGAGCETGAVVLLTSPAFDQFKAEMQPVIAKCAEGEVGEHDVLAVTDEAAARHQIRAALAREWVKAELRKLIVTPAPKQPESPSLLPPDPEPVAEPYPLAHVLRLAEALIRARIHCGPHAATAAAIWAAGSWGLHALDGTSAGPDLYPRLHIFAPTKRCGKSLFLEVVAYLSCRMMMATDISEAAMFRVVARYRPTIIVDEADTLIRKNPALINILNSGYKRTGFTIRNVEVQRNGQQSWEPTTFPTFVGVALAGIGTLPGTVEDRSIRIKMERQSADQRKRRITLLGLENTRQKLGPHLAAHAPAVRAAMAIGIADHEIPIGLNDRDADNWRPLLATAKLAGPDWLDKAQQAARALCAVSSDGMFGNEAVLRLVVEFTREQRREAVEQWRTWVNKGRQPAQRTPSQPAVGGAPSVVRVIPSDALAAWLIERDDSGFSDQRDTGPVKLKVARAMAAFGIRPSLHRVGKHPRRGYAVAEIRAAGRRYQ